VIMALILCWQNVGKPAYMRSRQAGADGGSPDVGGRAETLVDVTPAAAVRHAV
jgi:hypothetical protein